MKTVQLMLIIFMSIIAGQESFSQELTEEDKQYYLDSLQSPREVTRYFTLEGIKKYKIHEAENFLVNNFSGEDLTLRIKYLEALHILESQFTYQYTLDYLDSLELHPSFYSAEYLLDYKVRAAEILFYYGDYSQAALTFTLLDRDKPRVNTNAFPLLKKITETLPEYQDRAKNELLIITNNTTNDTYRRRALFDLEELFGEEMYTQMINMASNDPHPQNRIIVTEKLLSKYDQAKYNSFIRQRLIDEPVSSYRRRLVALLLENFGAISDYNYLLWYLTQEPDESNVNSITKKLTIRFIPSRPDSTVSVGELIDTLSSYNFQCQSLGWITSSGAYDTLTTFLSSITAAIEIEAFNSALEQTKAYNDYVYRSYNNNYINNHAFKFLWYYSEYLEEKLDLLVPDELPGPEIVSISPAITITKTKDFILTVQGSNFTKKTDVYWKGKRKKTKFISENVIEAKIKKKDIKKEGIYIVTVGNKKNTQSEGVEFTIYKELPEKIIPVLNCIEELDKKKKLAWFGYENYNEGIVLIEGKENEIKGGKMKKGKGKGKEKYDTVPPVIFLPGVHEKVFSVEFDDKKKLKWELLKEKAEAKGDTPICQ